MRLGQSFDKLTRLDILDRAFLEMEAKMKKKHQS